VKLKVEKGALGSSKMSNSAKLNSSLLSLWTPGKYKGTILCVRKRKIQYKKLE
jgi:hypothetical protein